jgi:phosphopantetheine adenylyltransferase
MSLIYADAPLMLDILVFTLDSSPAFSLDHATPLLPDQLGFTPQPEDQSSLPTHRIQSFPHLLIAGTFDHLHCGHKLLLSAAAFTATVKLTVALTDGDALLGRKKFKAAMQTLSIRTHAVSEFLSSLVPDLEIVLTVTEDVVGPAAYLQADAIAVTAETLPGAQVVNNDRIAAGEPSLEAVVLPILSSTSDKVSSTHTREFIAAQAGGEAALNAAKRWWIEAGGDDEWWSRVCKRYAEPWRHYHTLRHVLEMIDAVQDDHDIHLAAFFHDLVYVPCNTDNEEESISEFKRSE